MYCSTKFTFINLFGLLYSIFEPFNNNPMRNYNYTDFTAMEEKHSEFK